MKINEKNAAALALREANKLSDVLPLIPFRELRRVAPYYGYIDVQVGDLPPFLMFSNNDDYVAERYFWFGADAYEPMSLSVWLQLARSARATLDIGSYTGLYSLVAALANSRTKVYAFEALDRIYFRLIANKVVNSIGNIITENVGIADEVGERTLTIYSGDAIMVTGSTIEAASKARKSHDTKTIRITTVDEVAKVAGTVSLIKIDVEGAEHLVVRGGTATLNASRPDILCGLLPAASSTGQLEAALKPLGYRFFRVLEKEMTLEPLPELAVPAGEDRKVLMTTKDDAEIEALRSAAKERLRGHPTSAQH